MQVIQDNQIKSDEDLFRPKANDERGIILKEPYFHWNHEEQIPCASHNA